MKYLWKRGMDKTSRKALHAFMERDGYVFEVWRTKFGWERRYQLYVDGVLRFSLARDLLRCLVRVL